MATKKDDTKTYLIFRKGGQPLQLSSSVNLIQQWVKGTIERSKKGEWWKPLVFKDEEGEDSIAMLCEEIKIIVRGVPAPTQQEQPQGSHPLPPPPHMQQQPPQGA